MASQTGPVIGENKVVSLLLGIATWIIGTVGMVIGLIWYRRERSA